MKEKIIKIAEKLKKNKITEQEARKQFLSLFNINNYSSGSENQDLDDAIKIFELEENRKLNWNNDLDTLVISSMQVAISHIRNNR